RIGLEPSARLLADATRFQLAARTLRAAPGPYPALTTSLPSLVEDLLALDAELAEHLVDPAALRAYDSELLAALDGVKLTNADLRKAPETARGRLELLDLVTAYRSEKRRRDLLDFGDQIAHSATLATTRPEVGRILRDEFRVVLLDEYQDTSVAQRLLLSGLFGPGAERDGLVRCALLPTHAEELTWLADSLAHLVHTGTPPGEIAVLCRTAGDFARIQGELVARDIPVEAVGLSGLLHLPEIADLVAVCEVLQDPTANAALVRLLIGPRWRIGPRDLALLGRRARTLVHHGGPSDDPGQRLAEAVEGVDPAETISLADALDTFLEAEGPDDGLPFSAEARVRFAYLATELRDLRRSLGDPLMDVLHRVLAATGLEVELSASPHALAARRRETLGTFLDIAAGFAAKQGGESLDGDATLLAFLGFLRTAVQYEKGLDSSLPGGDNTVKVLTAHESKGLEWDVVAVPGLVGKQFPSEQARESWTSRPKVLPHALRGDAATLPDVGEWTARGLKSFKEAMKHHQETEELRLGYVTFTRPRSLLLGSGHWWGPQQKRPRGPSAFLEALREHCEAGHGEIEHWAAAPEDGEENPVLSEAATEQAWPLPLDPTATARRRAAAATVRAHLERRTGQQAGQQATVSASAAPSLSAHDPDWPPPPPDDTWDPDPYDPYDVPETDAFGLREADPFEDAAAYDVPDAGPFEAGSFAAGSFEADPFEADAFEAGPSGVGPFEARPSEDAAVHDVPAYDTAEAEAAEARAQAQARTGSETTLPAPAAARPA
ncbi:3'-5' exonuclease, partial [Streptomyces sp. WAC01526]|uniref:3'-5' exonuclease n=1 Tax=Streptomyces sp. WAC01526 TaxID=2588709 RepID=UPI0021CCC0CE